FQLAIPIAGLFFIWRRWRFCAGFVLSGAVLALISLWITGISESISHARSLLSVGAGVGPAPEQFRVPLRVIMMANFRGLLVGIAGAHLGQQTITVLTAGASAIVFFAVAILFFSRRHQRDTLLIVIETSL